MFNFCCSSVQKYQLRIHMSGSEKLRFLKFEMSGHRRIRLVPAKLDEIILFSASLLLVSTGVARRMPLR